MLSAGSDALHKNPLPQGIRSVQAGVLHAHTLIASFLRSACVAGNCASAVFLLHNPDTSPFILSVLDEKKRLSFKSVSLEPKSIAYSAFTKRCSVSSSGIQTDSNMRIPKTLAAVPVLDGGIMWGVLELFNSHEPDGFNPHRIEVLENFASDFAFCLSQCYESGGLDFFPFVSRDAISKDLLSVMDSLSQGSSPVLILGEEGTGRAFLARYLHAQSPACVLPFVSVQCRTMGQSDSDVAVLLDAAVKESEGGFLFFDEVAELSQKNQEALLSFMQNGSYSWRIASSSSREMEAAVEDGSFIPELYHRLSVMPVNVPPLRQRPKDVLDFAERFLRSQNRALGKSIKGFSSQAQDFLCSRAWTENLHELRLAVSHGALSCGGDIIQKNHLDYDSSFSVDSPDLHEAVTEFKRHHVKAVLERTSGNQTEAAKLLGVQRTYVSKLMVELGLK